MLSVNLCPFTSVHDSERHQKAQRFDPQIDGFPLFVGLFFATLSLSSMLDLPCCVYVAGRTLNLHFCLRV